MADPTLADVLKWWWHYTISKSVLINSFVSDQQSRHRIHQFIGHQSSISSCKWLILESDKNQCTRGHIKPNQSFTIYRKGTISWLHSKRILGSTTWPMILHWSPTTGSRMPVATKEKKFPQKQRPRASPGSLISQNQGTPRSQTQTSPLWRNKLQTSD